MRKLLSADFTRLWKNKVFWVGMACMALVACWMVCVGHGQNVRWADGGTDIEPNRLDTYLFQFAPAVGGFAIGIAETMVVAYGSSLYRDAIVYVILILILIIKPAGLLGKNVKEKV